MTQRVPVIPAISDDIPLNARRVLMAMKVTIEYLLAQTGTTTNRFGGSTGTGGTSGTSSHNSLDGLQGGVVGSFFHLNETQHTDLTDGGDSALHYHATDRDLGNATGSLAWSRVDKTGASVADLGGLAHTGLSGVQGGGATEQYHLTQDQWFDHTQLGDNAYHYHSADRARENHTGFQAAATIADLVDYIAEVTAHTTVPETIIEGATAVVPPLRQLIIHQHLYNNGTLECDGRLVIL